LNWERKYNFYW